MRRGCLNWGSIRIVMLDRIAGYVDGGLLLSLIVRTSCLVIVVFRFLQRKPSVMQPSNMSDEEQNRKLK